MARIAKVFGNLSPVLTVYLRACAMEEGQIFALARKAALMDVILHIGAHRTATTALQHHLSVHREELSQAGIGYWGPKITRSGLFRGAIGGSMPVLPWQERRFAGRCAMRAEGARQAGISKLIISDENLLGSLRGALEDTRLYGDAGRRVTAYAKGFAGHRLTIALCVRDYADWWTSALAFRLVRGGPLPRTALREHLVTQPRRWRTIVEELARLLPDANIILWTYDGLAQSPHRIVEEFTDIATPVLKSPWRNVRPTAEQLRQLMLDCDVDPDAFGWPQDQFDPFAPHEAEALRAQYAEDLNWLANGAGGFADFIDAPPAQTGERSQDGRGPINDRENRHLA